MTDPVIVPADEARCMAIVGTAWIGPQYCGYRVVGVDANGRPCCKRHLDKQLGVEWLGGQRQYPAGHGGHWQWRHGARREKPTL